MAGIEVKDYFSDDGLELQDPTDPIEEMDKRFMDKLARLVVEAMEVVAAGDDDISLVKFLNARGDFLDNLHDPEVVTWIDRMQQLGRYRYRKYGVG